MASEERRRSFDGIEIAAIAIAVIAVALHCRFLLFADIGTLATVVEDDVFYYLQPAWNFAHLHFFTFDGVHPMYGFQPLWILILSALAPLCGNKDIFLRASLLLATLLFAGAGALLFGVLRQANMPRRGALVAVSCLWFANPGLIAVLPRGKENALQAFLLLACGLSVTALARGKGRGMLPVAGLGALLGLLTLCRTNALIFALLVWGLYPVVRKLAFRDALRDTVLSVGAFMIVVLPWCIYAQNQFGTVLPTSGLAKLSEFHLSEIGHLLFSVEAIRSIPLFFAGYAWAIPPMLLAIGFILLSKRSEAPSIPFGAWLMFGYAIANFVSCFLLLNKWFAYAVWYRAPEQVAVGVVLGLLISAAVTPADGIRKFAPQVFLTYALLIAVIRIGMQRQAFVAVSGDYQHEALLGTQWVKANLPVGSHIGSWNAGLIGYELDGYTVVNLDGLANSRSYLAVKDDPARLRQYLREEGITYLMDADFIRPDAPGAYFDIVPMNEARVLYKGTGPVSFGGPHDHQFVVLEMARK